MFSSCSFRHDHDHDHKLDHNHNFFQAKGGFDCDSNSCKEAAIHGLDRNFQAGSWHDEKRTKDDSKRLLLAKTATKHTADSCCRRRGEKQ